ncbi:MAG TPA: hypothetical protein DDZ89_14270, partial [Clostridiales bacterium]|nr:hypothetical protein [Clostridiales bacterium]
MDKADPLVEYKVKVYKKHCDMSTTAGQVEFLNLIAGALAKIDNRVEVEMYGKKIAHDYGISLEAILSEVYKNEKVYKTKDTGKLQVEAPTTMETKNDSADIERRLLILLAMDNDYIPEFNAKEGDTFFEDNDHLLIYKEMKKNYRNKKTVRPSSLMQMLDEDKAALFAQVLQNTH